MKRVSVSRSKNIILRPCIPAALLEIKQMRCENARHRHKSSSGPQHRAQQPAVILASYCESTGRNNLLIDDPAGGQEVEIPPLQSTYLSYIQIRKDCD